MVKFGTPGAGAHFTDPSRARQIDSPVTFGVDDDGVDVTFYGATSGIYLLWDESVNRLQGVGKLDLLFAGSASSIVWDASADTLILTGAFLKSIDATTVTPDPWCMAITKTGTNFWLKINATSLSTASYSYIKLTSTSVIS